MSENEMPVEDEIEVVEIDEEGETETAGVDGETVEDESEPEEGDAEEGDADQSEDEDVEDEAA